MWPTLNKQYINISINIYLRNKIYIPNTPYIQIHWKDVVNDVVVWHCGMTLWDDIVRWHCGMKLWDDVVGWRCGMTLCDEVVVWRCVVLTERCEVDELFTAYTAWHVELIEVHWISAASSGACCRAEVIQYRAYHTGTVIRIARVTVHKSTHYTVYTIC